MFFLISLSLYIFVMNKTVSDRIDRFFYFMHVHMQNFADVSCIKSRSRMSQCWHSNTISPPGDFNVRNVSYS